MNSPLAGKSRWSDCKPPETKVKETSFNKRQIT